MRVIMQGKFLEMKALAAQGGLQPASRAAILRSIRNFTTALEELKPHLYGDKRINSHACAAGTIRSASWHCAESLVRPLLS